MNLRMMLGQPFVPPPLVFETLRHMLQSSCRSGTPRITQSPADAQKVFSAKWAAGGPNARCRDWEGVVGLLSRPLLLLHLVHHVM